METNARDSAHLSRRVGRAVPRRARLQWHVLSRPDVKRAKGVEDCPNLHSTLPLHFPQPLCSSTTNTCLSSHGASLRSQRPHVLVLSCTCSPPLRLFVLFQPCCESRVCRPACIVTNTRTHEHTQEPAVYSLECRISPSVGRSGRAFGAVRLIIDAAFALISSLSTQSRARAAWENAHALISRNSHSQPCRQQPGPADGQMSRRLQGCA